jgi:hypothetical protein
VVQGNYLGIDPTGSALRNDTGINISSSKNFIGGITATTRNIISGNQFGIVLESGNNNGIHGNLSARILPEHKRFQIALGECR